MTKRKQEYIQKSKELLSKRISEMERAGFGDISEIVRFAIFHNPQYNEKILPLFLKQNPQLLK